MFMLEYIQPRFFDLMLGSELSPLAFARVSRHPRATYLRLAGITGIPATKPELFMDQDQSCKSLCRLPRKLHTSLVSE